MVLDERSEHEPDDPEFDVTTGEELVPEAPGPGESAGGGGPPPELATAFWGCVLFVNVGLFTGVGGVAVYVAAGMRTLGLALLAVTLVCAVGFVRMYGRYLEFVEERDDEGVEEVETEGG